MESIDYMSEAPVNMDPFSTQFLEKRDGLAARKIGQSTPRKTRFNTKTTGRLNFTAHRSKSVPPRAPKKLKEQTTQEDVNMKILKLIVQFYLSFTMVSYRFHRSHILWKKGSSYWKDNSKIWLIQRNGNLLKRSYRNG
jgi:hypothetical protein